MSYAAVSIGLFIFILAYFTFNAPKPATLNPPEPEVQTSQYCEAVDPATAPTFQAPSDNADKITDEDELLGSPIEGGGCGGTKIRHVLGDTTTYRLIRKNVPLSKTSEDKKGNRNENFDDSSCHFDTAEKLDINIPGIDKTQYKVFYPEVSGEIDLKEPIFSRTRGRETDLMYFIDYGLVFLLHINPDGSMTELKGGTTKGVSETFVLADVYQDVNRTETNPLPGEACDTTKGAQIASSNQVLVPGQNTSADQEQLQLQYFVFGNGASSGQVVNGWGIHCKPAVYLYPPKKQLVNVKVYPSGFLTYVDPPYDKDKGWTVWAEPNGILTTTYNLSPTTYPYLYFESKIRDEVIEKPNKGWVIKSGTSIKGQVSREWFGPLETHFDQILPKLGLNQKQTQDFIEYWKKTLPEAPYYFVGVIDQRNVNEIERLEITPKPDYINRVRIYFERLDSPKQVGTPTIQTINDERLTMNDFRVVEWGGMVKNDPNHPFTCSQ